MAQDKRRTLGGPRYNKPHEVHDKLNALGKNYNQFYDDIMRNAIITWDLDADEVWVEGKFRAGKTQMIRWTDLSKSSFHIKWGKIVQAGLIRVEQDGVWVMTMVIRKEDVSVSDAEVRRIQQQQLGMIEELQEMKAILEEWKKERVCPVSRTKKGRPDDAKESGQPDKKGSSPDKKGSSPDSDILFKGLKKKTSHSNANTIISGFYRLIGQNRISKKKRERALDVGKKLRRDGFSLEDIAFAVEWTVENAKEEPYDFAIIEHTIGQALAARDKIEAERTAIEERDKAVEEERLRRETEERERQELETYKVSLSPEERDKLREEARAALGKDGLSANMMTEFLVNIKENQLLREQIEKDR
jgi:hypothetical protein